MSVCINVWHHYNTFPGGGRDGGRAGEEGAWGLKNRANNHLGGIWGYTSPGKFGIFNSQSVSDAF